MPLQHSRRERFQAGREAHGVLRGAVVHRPERMPVTAARTAPITKVEDHAGGRTPINAATGGFSAVARISASQAGLVDQPRQAAQQRAGDREDQQVRAGDDRPCTS